MEIAIREREREICVGVGVETSKDDKLKRRSFFSTFTRQNDYPFFKSQNGCRLYIGMVMFFSIGLILILDGLI